MKFVLVTGSIVSGLGKGVTTSSVGLLLQNCGLSVTAIKIDGYFNGDAGTMGPTEHGECYVLEDGGETDLDLGSYERFLDGVTLTRDHNLTTGKVMASVLAAERRGDYLGKTVQFVPHVTDAIQAWLTRTAAKVVHDSGRTADVCLVELGGTVGDIETAMYLEAFRQMQFRLGRSNCCLLHVTLVPTVGASDEQKTKPAQHGVRDMRTVGLVPDLLICRSAKSLQRAAIDKLAQYAMLPTSHVISVSDTSNIYRVPQTLLDAGVPAILLNQLQLGVSPCKTVPGWCVRLAERIDDAALPSVTVAVVGKYVSISDCYLSLAHALRHAAAAAGCRVTISWIDAERLESKTIDEKSGQEAWRELKGADAILVPGGFGSRSVEGMICAARHARTSLTPYFGICLGFQVSVIEWCRTVCGWADANSTEFVADTKHPVVVQMLEHDLSQKGAGGTMRLGMRQTTVVKQPSLAHALYNSSVVRERHRHRYEVNPIYIRPLNDAGLIVSGIGDGDSHRTDTDASDVKATPVQPRTDVIAKPLPGTTTIATSEPATPKPMTAAPAPAVGEAIPVSDVPDATVDCHTAAATSNPSTAVASAATTSGGTAHEMAAPELRADIIEMPAAAHPFYLGVQYHPEYRSRPNCPSPPFFGFLRAALAHRIAKRQQTRCSQE